MKKFIMSVVSVLLAGTAFCAVTMHLSLDCRDGAKVADTAHPLVYDATWYEGGVTARITANGQEIVSGTSGSYAWTPSKDDVNLLTLNVYNDSDEVVGTEQVFYLSREDLTELVIPEGATEIGAYAFVGGQFTSVTIPNSVTNVAPTAFAGCENVVAVAVPSWVNVASTFTDSKGKIAQVTLSAQGDIPASAYSGCSSLERVDIPSMADWLGISFANAKANPLSTGASLYVGGEEVTELLIPDGTTEIGEYAFAGGQFTSVTIPNSVTNVATTAFVGCSNIVEVSLGSGLFGETKHEVHVCDEPEGDWSDNGNWQYRSKTIGDNGSTQMSVHLNLKEPQACSFKWKVSSELDWDKLEYLVDGTREWYISGSTGWETEEVALGAGEHTIVWRYYKDGLQSSGEDCGWVDISELMALSAVVAEQTTLATLFPASYASIRSVRLDDGFKEIGRSMFAGCSSLEAFAVPPKVTRIRADAFAGCDAIKRVDVASFDQWVMMEFENENANPLVEGATLYVNGQPFDSSASVVDGLTILDGWVVDCEDRGAEMVVVPEGVVGIWHGAFAGMYDLAAVSLPSSLKYIGERAFAECTYLDGLVIPDGVEIIASGAFEDCSWMQTITLGAGVRSVGDRAFAGCTKLTKATFAEGLETVGDSAFSNCWRMISVSLPVSVSNVAATAFKDCAYLVGVTVPTGIAPMSEWFAPVYRQIENVTVPEGTTEVCAEMFVGCAALKTVELPEGVTNIASGAFRDCAALETILLPESLEAIGDEAFAGCTALKVIVLPKDVAVLGKRVFSGCAALSDVTLSRALTAIPVGTFAGCDALDSFVVPEAVTELGSQIVPSATTAIYYLGNAPAYAADVYAQANAALVSYVVDGTKGWDGRPTSRDIPRNWPTTNARAIMPWSPVKIDVTFVGNGGTFESPAGESCVCKQIVCTAYSLPQYEPVRKGYRFDGYWTDADGGTRVTSGVAVKRTNDHSLYAHWKECDTPTVEGDEGATVTGDAETGFVIKPSEGKTAVEVTIPQGVDAAKVTVEVSPKVASVKPNGAKVKIVSEGADITEFLNVPAADGNGVVDLTKATVKEEIVKEAMDVEKGAKIVLDAVNPSLTTPNTRKGLFYQLREGETLGGMKDGDSTIGDGNPWSPEITVKGGNSAFYSIGVGKGD